MNRDPNGSLDRSAGFFVTLGTALVVVSHRPRDASRFELERGVRGAIPDSRERHSAEEDQDQRVRLQDDAPIIEGGTAVQFIRGCNEPR